MRMRGDDNSPNRLNEIWILGSGFFGRKAFERFCSGGFNTSITVVDKNPANLPGKRSGRVNVVCREAVGWLSETFSENAAVDFIIPAIPEHVAAEWLCLTLAREHINTHKVRLSTELLSGFPNVSLITDNRAVISYASFLCPDNCPEPDGICTYNGEKRRESLHRCIDRKKVAGFETMVLQSRQLFPGVGGLLPKDLLALLERARHLRGRQLLVSTACRCHGVMDGLMID